jgi:hypothetical protein
MPAQCELLVVVYEIATGQWIVAEINGDQVLQLGPFSSRIEVEGLLPSLYPDQTVLELGAQDAVLDSAAVTILGNAVFCPQSRKSEANL